MFSSILSRINLSAGPNPSDAALGRRQISTVNKLTELMEIELFIEHLTSPSEKTTLRLKTALSTKPYFLEKWTYEEEDTEPSFDSREKLRKKILALIDQELADCPWLKSLEEFSKRLGKLDKSLWSPLKS